MICLSFLIGIIFISLKCCDFFASHIKKKTNPGLILASTLKSLLVGYLET